MDLLKVNMEAWQVWDDIKTQMRVGGTGVIGLDYREMRQAIRDHGFHRSRGLELKIKALEWEKIKCHNLQT